MKRKSLLPFLQIALAILISTVSFSASAEDNSAELAKNLSNPIAALISVPIQGNFDENYGTADDGERYVYNIQLVIPFSISDDWNVISRTILPIINQNAVTVRFALLGRYDALWARKFRPAHRLHLVVSKVICRKLSAIKNPPIGGFFI